jgi:hypothetical protein
LILPQERITPTLEPTIKEVNNDKPKEDLEAEKFLTIKGHLKEIEGINCTIL